MNNYNVGLSTSQVSIVIWKIQVEKQLENMEKMWYGRNENWYFLSNYNTWPAVVEIKLHSSIHHTFSTGHWETKKM